jgi:hypothetical protein
MRVGIAFPFLGCIRLHVCARVGDRGAVPIMKFRYFAAACYRPANRGIVGFDDFPLENAGITKRAHAPRV